MFETSNQLCKNMPPAHYREWAHGLDVDGQIFILGADEHACSCIFVASILLLRSESLFLCPGSVQSEPCVYLPVVPHKAVAEVSEEETYRRGWLL